MRMSERPESGQREAHVNCLVIGADHVGKSALTVRFLTRRFIGEYGETETVYTHNVTVDGRDICFNIWDSPHAQVSKVTPFPTEYQMHWTDGFIFVYSICDRESFEVSRRQLRRLRQARGDGPPALLLGNKTDLSHRRAVSSHEARLLALSNHCGFLEVSAAENSQGALLAFHQLLRLVRQARAEASRSSSLRALVRSVSAVLGGRKREWTRPRPRGGAGTRS
ncbi:ras-related and estrogen-regulated growth inhibitor-like protein [Mobula hypostoma]|uniref:ras-related and estrogen-regulated growth inhibitor-like protein n=1 Tax=Mobula hypostoma TaxID=723540 RepID=UPI002FC3634A